MSDHDLPDLPDDLADLLRAERARPDEGADMAARLLARVQATVSADAIPHEAPADAPPEAASTQAASTQAASTQAAGTHVTAASTQAGTIVATKGTLGLVALAFVAGTGVGAFSHAKLTSPEVRTRVEVREVVRTIEVPTPSIPIAAVEDAGIAEAVSAHDAGARDASAGDASTRADAGLDAEVTETGRDLGLADENALVTRAQTALARGRAGEALEALFEHQRRFPRGQFTEEREALAIQALARLGRTEQAAARAERFRARYPGSMLMRVVDQAVRPE